MTLISVTDNIIDKALSFQADVIFLFNLGQLHKARSVWIAISVLRDSTNFQRFTAFIKNIPCPEFFIVFSSKTKSQSCCSKIHFSHHQVSRI